jgi:hypothetical protein
MTGIDSALASMLVSRIDSVLDSVGAGARTSPAQSGATGLTVDTPAPADGAAALADAPPPASAQAILSEVALTLDAISRFGGEATPAVIGEVPIWPAPPAIDTAAGGGALFQGAAAGGSGAAEDGANAGAGASASAGPNAGAGTAQTGSAGSAGSATAAASVGAAATAMPVEALAAALEQTVNESGLFYESHLAQWLSGGYPAEALASEPQTRLAAEAIQLPLDWSGSSGTAAAGAMPGWQTPGASIPAGGGWLPHELPPQLSLQAFGAGPHAAGGPPYPGAAADGTAWRGAQTTLLEDAALHGASAGHGANLPPDVRSSIAASIHPATIPLVRQQLDVLATQQFRWTGEVWPGAKLDWTIEPEREQRARSGEAGDDPEQTWRTRVTLALPTLGSSCECRPARAGPRSSRRAVRHSGGAWKRRGSNWPVCRSARLAERRRPRRGERLRRRRRPMRVRRRKPSRVRGRRTCRMWKRGRATSTRRERVGRFARSAP